MEAEAALANTLSNEFKTLMSGEKAAKNGGRKNARQQNQKKANMRSCSSLPTGMNTATNLEKADAINNNTSSDPSAISSLSSTQPFSAASLPSQVAVEKTSKLETKGDKYIAPSATNKTSTSSIVQKNAIAKKENEMKLKFVVEKIKSKLNSAQIAAASSNSNKPAAPLQQSNNHAMDMDFIDQSLQMKSTNTNYQHSANLVSDFSNGDTHSHRQNGFNLNNTIEETIDLYSPPSPPSSSAVNQNSNSAKKNAHVAKVSRIYDPDKHCGVTADHTDPLTGLKQYGEPCLRSLTCKVS
jgi:hypothetical protein